MGNSGIKGRTSIESLVLDELKGFSGAASGRSGGLS